MLPSPKFQIQLVGTPVEESVNWIVVGIHPVVLFAVKLATGSWPTVMYPLLVNGVLIPHVFEAVSETV